MVYYSGKMSKVNKYIKILNELKEGKKTFIACGLDNILVNLNKKLKEKGYKGNSYSDFDKNFWLNKEGIEILLTAEPIIPMFKILKTLEYFGGKICFVTKRPKELERITEEWFLLNKIKKDIDVYYITNNSIGIDADIYIEDDPREIEIIKQYGKDVIVPEWEYNKHIDDVIYIKIAGDKESIGGRKYA